MRILRIKSYSDSERKDLTGGDKVSLGAIKVRNALITKKKKELEKNIRKPDATEEDYDQYRKYRLKKNIAKASIAPIALAGLGAYKRGAAGLKDGLVVGGVAGSGDFLLNQLLDSEKIDTIKKFKRHPEIGYKINKNYDLRRLADNEITKEEFIKRNYKDKKFSKSEEDDDKSKGKKKNSHQVLKGLGVIGASTAGMLTGLAAGAKVDNDAAKNYLQSDLIKDNDILKERLINQGEKDGVKFINSKGLENSMAIGRGRLGRLITDTPFGEYVKNSNIKPLESMGLKSSEVEPVKKALLTDSVVLGKGRFAGADVLAHELGHSHYQYRGGIKGLPIEAAHQLHGLSQFAASPAGAFVGGGLGFKSGLKKAKLESVGEKESKFNRIQGLTPAIISTPMLISEAAASRKGLQLLKKAGASKESLAAAKKNLTNAWKTYGGVTLGSTAISEGSRGIGYGAGKIAYRKNRKNKDNKKDENKKD